MCLFQTFIVKFLCEICNGIGRIDDGQDSYRNLKEICPACGGKGFIIDQVNYNYSRGLVIYDGKKGQV